MTWILLCFERFAHVQDTEGGSAVAEIIAPYPVAKSQAELKGVSKAMSVYHLARMAS